MQTPDEQKMSNLYALIDRDKAKSRSSSKVLTNLKHMAAVMLNDTESAACVDIFERMVADPARGTQEPAQCADIFERLIANVTRGAVSLERSAEQRNLIARALGAHSSMHRVARVLHAVAGRNKYIDGREFIRGDLRALDAVWEQRWGVVDATVVKFRVRRRKRKACCR